MAKKPKNDKKISNNDNLPDKTAGSELADCFANIAESEEELNYLKFNALLRVGMSPHKAGKTLGFSDAFCSVGVYQQLKNPKSALRRAAEKLDNFTKNTASRYRKTFSPLLAPVLAEIDLAVVGKLKDDPTMAIRNPQILKQLKQQGGILADDAPGLQMINLSEVRNIMLNVSAVPRVALPEPAQDAEVIEGAE